MHWSTLQHQKARKTTDNTESDWWPDPAFGEEKKSHSNETIQEDSGGGRTTELKDLKVYNQEMPWWM